MLRKILCLVFGHKWSPFQRPVTALEYTPGRNLNRAKIIGHISAPTCTRCFEHDHTRLQPFFKSQTAKRKFIEQMKREMRNGLKPNCYQQAVLDYD